MGSIICVTSDGVLLSNAEHTIFVTCMGGETFRVFIPDEYNKYRVKLVEVVYCGEWALFDGKRFYTVEFNGCWTDRKVD